MMEDQATPKSEEEVEATDTNQTSGLNWKKLMLLSSSAAALSWALLAVYMINFGYGIYADSQQYAGVSLGWNVIPAYLPRVASLLLGMFYFVILQILAEGINVWLEADDKLELLVEK